MRVFLVAREPIHQRQQNAGHHEDEMDDDDGMGEVTDFFPSSALTDEVAAATKMDAGRVQVLNSLFPPQWAIPQQYQCRLILPEVLPITC